jgi:hypothetical protein
MPVSAAQSQVAAALLSGNGPLIIILAVLGWMPLSDVSSSTREMANAQSEIRKEIQVVRTELHAEIRTLRDQVATYQADRWTRQDHQEWVTQEFQPLEARLLTLERGATNDR